MKILIFNDTRSYHSGCEAVMDFIVKKLLSQGHELRGGYLNLGNVLSKNSWEEKHDRGRRKVEDEDLDWCDSVLVNGEGSGTTPFNLNALNRALDKGKRGYLVNSIIRSEKITGSWRKLLPKLNEVSTRGVISMANAEQVGVEKVNSYLDFSFFADIDESSLYYDFKGSDVLGCFYEEQTDRYELEESLGRIKRMPMIPRICDWSYLVKSLRTSGLYITGRHHGMYAACKARTPFVLYQREGHKLQDLLDSAGVAIPIPKSKVELIDAIYWAKENIEVYYNLFEWMERQQAWPGIRDNS